MANRHLIGKQVFELGLRSSENSHMLQQKVSDMVWGELLPRLAELFDGMTREDEVILIDKVELDLGRIDLQNADYQELADLIVNRLREALSIALDRPKKRRGPGDVQLTPPERRSAQINDFDLWLHWLEKGTLPRYSVAPETDWMPSVLETLGLDHKSVDRLQAVLDKHPVALDRLVMQHAAKDLQSIVELFTGISQKELLPFLKELQLLYGITSPSTKMKSYRELELVVWRRILTKTILEGKKMDALDLAAETLKIPSIPKIINEQISEKKIMEEDYPFLCKLLKTKPEILESPGVFQEKIGENLESSGGESFMESPQFLKNAGAVLIHPFLNPFFKKLKLMEAGEFKNFKSQSKSVLLIHFLATGEERPKEYDTILPKLLCGMPANLPLDHTLQLTKTEKKEANHLLQAAIDHWGALGNTSPDGLREGFLVREGKLIQEQTGLKLYIEQKGQDILLDNLPWNLNLLKLPWMKEILRVEWR